MDDDLKKAAQLSKQELLDLARKEQAEGVVDQQTIASAAAVEGEDEAVTDQPANSPPKQSRD